MYKKSRFLSFFLMISFISCNKQIGYNHWKYVLKNIVSLFIFPFDFRVIKSPGWLDCVVYFSFFSLTFFQYRHFNASNACMIWMNDECCTSFTVCIFISLYYTTENYIYIPTTSLRFSGLVPPSSIIINLFIILTYSKYALVAISFSK
jgi:hypothetical protein